MGEMCTLIVKVYEMYMKNVWYKKDTFKTQDMKYQN